MDPKTLFSSKGFGRIQGWRFSPESSLIQCLDVSKIIFFSENNTRFLGTVLWTGIFWIAASYMQNTKLITIIITSKDVSSGIFILAKSWGFWKMRNFENNTDFLMGIFVSHTNNAKICAWWWLTCNSNIFIFLMKSCIL